MVWVAEDLDDPGVGKRHSNNKTKERHFKSKDPFPRNTSEITPSRYDAAGTCTISASPPVSSGMWPMLNYVPQTETSSQSVLQCHS